jgi:CRP-like cAMP-binding protein
MSDRDIDWLMAHGRKERVPAGTVLIREGQPVDSLYIILDGVLEVSGPAVGSERPIRLGCGEVLGEVSFVDSRPPMATVTAAAETTVLTIPRTDLKRKLAEDAEFAARFYRSLAVFLAHRLRSTGRRLAYGREQPLYADVEYEDELGAEVLDNLAVAGARFDRVLQRFLAK